MFESYTPDQRIKIKKEEMQDRISLQEKKKRKEVKEWLEKVKKKKMERIKELLEREKMLGKLTSEEYRELHFIQENIKGEKK